jgi:hypothetical protein
MMAYIGTNSHDVMKVPVTGGSVRVAIASNVGQGNGGTSLLCKRVWLIANNPDIRVNLYSACTATTGIPVPQFNAANNGNERPLCLEVNDVANLYFYGATDAKVVDILYRR